MPSFLWDRVLHGSGSSLFSAHQADVGFVTTIKTSGQVPLQFYNPEVSGVAPVMNLV